MELRVRFAETDQMGVAHHAAYVVWLEAARVEWLRDLGLSYRDLEAQGISLAVTGLDVRYRSAVRFDDRLRIEVVLDEARSRRLRFGYRIVRIDDGSLGAEAAVAQAVVAPAVVAPAVVAQASVAEATTVHVPTDRSGAAMRLPPAWLDTVSGQLAPPRGRPTRRAGS